MEKKERRTYSIFVVVKLSCNFGVQIKQSYMRLTLDTLDVSIAAENAKNIVLNSPDFDKRHCDILSIYVMAVAEKRGYEYAECIAKRVGRDLFEVTVDSYPLHGIACCTMDDDFFANAELKCKTEDACNKCYKRKGTCLK